jgi:hypothetical protein
VIASFVLFFQFLKVILKTGGKADDDHATIVRLCFHPEFR